ncbi:MAG TPA: dihydrodipicolinate synthase family protein [Gemmatimonadales bacterium]|jgi:4-hydroxy-2-oxoglutarate aldolase
MTRRPSGLLVPLTTPFDPETGDIAPVPLRENARAVLQAGVSGIVAAGSTGEASLLSDDEYRSLVGWLRDVVPEDRWLIAGAGRESTRATIAACRTAAEQGADAVLVRPPGYYGSSLSIAAMTAHFRAVADASPVPVLLYNIPKYTHLTLSDAVFSALTDHPNVVGAKDSSGDLKNFASYRAAAPAWALFVGSGHLYYAALELGAVGGVLGAACFAASLSVKIRDAFASGDRAAAGAAQEILAPINKEIVGTLGVPGVKAAVDLAGLAGGPVRAPLKDLGSKERARLATMLAEAGVTPRKD